MVHVSILLMILIDRFSTCSPTPRVAWKFCVDQRRTLRKHDLGTICFVQSLVHVVEKLLRTSRSNTGWIKQEFYFFDTLVFSTVSFHFSWEALFPTSPYCFLLKCISLTTKKASGTSLKKEIFLFSGGDLPTLKVHSKGMKKRPSPGCEWLPGWHVFYIHCEGLGWDPTLNLRFFTIASRLAPKNLSPPTSGNLLGKMRRFWN